MKSLLKLYQKLAEAQDKLEKLTSLSKSQEIDWVIQKTRENIDKYKDSIRQVQLEREQSMQLEAIYFPYSRILDPFSLRKAAFLFDKVWFLDMLGKEMRNITLSYTTSVPGYYPYQRLTRAWEEVQADYEFLLNKNQIEMYDTSLVSNNFEPLIGENLRNDVQNKTLQSMFKDRSNTWALLKEDFPWTSTKDFFTVQGKFHLYPGFFNWIGADRPIPFDQTDRLPTGTQFIFVDPLQGASIKLSQATIVSTYENIPLFTDKSDYLEMLALRIQNSSKTSEGNQPQDETKYRLNAKLAFANLEKFLDRDALQRLSIKEIVAYKMNCGDSKKRFNEKVAELCSEIENNAYTEEGLLKLIDKHVTPEIRKFHDDVKQVYEKMFGSLVDTGSKALIAGMSSSAITGVVFQNFSYAQLLSVGVGVATTTLLPIIPLLVNLIIERRHIKRNAFVYLLDIPKD